MTPLGEQHWIRTSQGYRYAVWKREAKRGCPIWFCGHGFLGNHRDWADFLAELGEGDGWVLPDLRGHGDSDRPVGADSYQPDSLYRDLAEIWRETLGEVKGPRIAVGYSMGGRQLLGAILDHGLGPDRLVLMGSHFGIGEEGERQRRLHDDRAKADRLRREGLEPFVTFWYNQPLLASQPPRDPMRRKEWMSRRLSNDAEALAGCLEGFSPGATPDYSGRARELRYPVLLVSGGKDPRYRAHYEEMIEQIPDACHVSVPGAGHSVPLENPKATASLCRQFSHTTAN